MTLWQGRLGSETSVELMAFTESLSFDQRLAKYDIMNSRAHAKALQAAGILNEKEMGVLMAALDHVSEEISDGKFKYKPNDEDIHSAIERRVTEIAGSDGAKLHTGRSRNDQVATDLRMYVKEILVGLIEGVLQLQEVLVEKATNSTDIVMPGYTHMQRGQTVSLAHHLLAHCWALSRDVDRFLDAYRRTDVSPLGAGAVGGSSFPLRPDVAASELGFSEVFENSMDAVGDRDFVADTLYAITMLFVHLSRMGEEIVLWTSQEFDFAVLRNDYATGSSLLANKKNADIAELVRGKTGRIIGGLAGFLAMLKGLPLSYNRDMQEDKEPLFDAVDKAVLALAAVAGMYESMEMNIDVMRDKANDPDLAALDLTEMLVTKGVPFREAHETIGDLVRQSHERQIPLSELLELHPLLGHEALELLTPTESLQRRQSPGGSGFASVNTQLQSMKERIESDRARINPTG
jgi:argininosuccinate lyase